jgi:hypothetical protein
MDTVTILRELSRRRRALVGVGTIALLAGILVLYQVSFPPKLTSRKYQVGVATANILVDTPNSQVVDVAPRGSDTLGGRASLLANVMVDGVVKAAIARSAGLNPSKLAGVSMSAADPPATVPTNPRAPVLTTQVVTLNDGSDLPMIEVRAQAMDAATATKLATAAVTGLRTYIASRAAAQRIPDAQRLQITGLGVPQVQTAARGPTYTLALAVVIIVFGLGCGCILLVVNLRRSWRAAEDREHAGAGEPATQRVHEPPVVPVVRRDGERRRVHSESQRPFTHSNGDRLPHRWLSAVGPTVAETRLRSDEDPDDDERQAGAEIRPR